MPLRYQLVIIGTGQAASPLAEGLVEKGWSVAVVERSSPGGSCVNFGCTPTKAAVWTARVHNLAKRAADYGLEVTAAPPDLERIYVKIREIVALSVKGVRSEFGENPVLIAGEAKLLGREGNGFRIGVGDQELVAERVVVNTGTRSIIPPIPGLEDAGYLTAENWLEDGKLPRRLTIVGGGYIAAEMGQFYARMGSEVTIIEKGGQLLTREDKEVGDSICDILTSEGVQLRYNMNVERVEPEGNAWRLICGEETVGADSIFVATGRKPNTDGIGLEEIGVELDKKGFANVDEHSETAVTGLYVAGDARGGPMFTHTAWDDGRVILTHLVGGGRPTTDRVVPYAIFTDPQLGRVGLSEKEAKEKGIDYEVRRFDLKHNGIAQATRQTNGYVKVLVSGEKILGATVLAPEGADLAQLFSVFVACGISAAEFRKLLVTHPTWSEAAQTAIL
ncbi:mercuric reductase [soil metagenome]